MASPQASRCHLLDSPGRLTDLRPVDHLYEDSHYGVSIMRCSACQILYALCYVEVYDDSWTFFAAITEDEADRMRQDYDVVTDLIVSRPHIVWPPTWKSGPYWNEGMEDALTMGPRPW